jgi:hypothetical protein
MPLQPNCEPGVNATRIGSTYQNGCLLNGGSPLIRMSPWSAALAPSQLRDSLDLPMATSSKQKTRLGPKWGSPARSIRVPGRARDPPNGPVQRTEPSRRLISAYGQRRCSGAMTKPTLAPFGNWLHPVRLERERRIVARACGPRGTKREANLTSGCGSVGGGNSPKSLM